MAYTSIYNGSQVDKGIGASYVPTLQSAPTSTTLTYTRTDLPSGSQTVNFEIGQLCRVANAGSSTGYDFYQLQNIVVTNAGEQNETTTASWLKTDYESKAAAASGTDLSLVTTGEKYEWNEKAEKDGEYQDLTAGNIIGEFSDNNAEFSYRPTAGAVDIESGKADNGAKIESIKGNTIAWNQMVQNGNFASASIWRLSGSTYSVANNEATVTIDTESGTYIGIYQEILNTIAGHKYYMAAEIKTNDNSSGQVGLVTTFYLSGLYKTVDGINGQYVSVKAIKTCAESSDSLIVFQANARDGVVLNIKNVMLIDLTLIYGSGNEPSTVAAFEADYMKWFGKPLTYEDYDAGSLRPVKMSGLKTVGFNAYDVSKETSDKKNVRCSVSIIGDTISMDITGSDAYWGEVSINTAYSTTGGALYKVLPNTTYNLHLSNSFFAKNFISFWNKSLYASSSTAYILSSDGTFTTPSDCEYISLRIGTGFDISSGTYTTKVCINLSHSGARDGQYEPYWTSTLNLPVTTMTGKLNGQGSSVVVFPDGMKSAGSVYDEIVHRGNQTIAIKRVGSVDLTLYNWEVLTAAKGEFRSSIIPGVFPRSITNLVFNKCDYIPRFSNEDLSCYIYIGGRVIINDLRHANESGAEFATAMSGVILYYELATPEEYLLDDFELPQVYDVDDYGTEEVQLGTNGIAPVLDIKYGINAPDTIKNLPHNYVSVIGEQNLTEAQKERARRNIGVTSSVEYESKEAEEGGTDESLVTTGEKYTWNSKQDSIVFNTPYNASSNKAVTMSDIPSSLPANGGNAATVNNHTVAADVPSNAVFTDNNTTYKLNLNGTDTGGGSTSLGTVYGATTAGTSGQYLKSSGSGAPGWADMPTSLPASDVSAWAKAANKPSYAYEEIGYSVATTADNSNTAGIITIDGTKPLTVIALTGDVSSLDLASGKAPEAGHSAHVILTAASACTVAIAHDASVRVCPGGEDISLQIAAGGYAEVDFLNANSKIFVRSV